MNRLSLSARRLQPGPGRRLLGAVRDARSSAATLFHADSAFNPRGAGVPLLLAHDLPPPRTGGVTEFADALAAYAGLYDATQDRFNDYGYELATPVPPGHEPG